MFTSKIAVAAIATSLLVLNTLHAADPARLTLVGHGKAVVDVEISPDGLQMASMAADGETILWDLKAGRGQRLPSIVRSLSPGRYLAFTRASKPILLAGVRDQGFGINLATHAVIGEYGGYRDRHSSGEITPAGGWRTMGYGPDATLVCRDLLDKNNLYQVPLLQRHISWNLSPNGELMMLGSSPADSSTDRTHIGLIDTRTGSQVGKLRGFTEGVASASWVNDRRVLVLESRVSVSLWEVTPAVRLVAKHELDQDVFDYLTTPDWSCLAVSADGSTAAVAADGHLKPEARVSLFRLANDEIKPLRTVDARRPLQISADGKRILGGNPSNGYKKFVVVDAEGTTLAAFQPAENDTEALLTADGADYIVGHENGTISVYPAGGTAGDPFSLVADLPLEQPQAPKMPEGIRNLYRPFENGEVVFASANDFCATQGKNVTIATLGNGARHLPVWHQTASRRFPAHAQIETWTFLPDSSLLVDRWGIEDGYLHLAKVNAATGQLIADPAARKVATLAVQVAPDGKFAVSVTGSTPGPGNKQATNVEKVSGMLVDVKSGKTLKTLFENVPPGVGRFVFSSSGRRLAGLMNKQIRLWNTETGKELPLADKLNPYQFWLIDDGKVLVVEQNNAVLGIDVDSSAEAFTWNPATNQVGQNSAIAFSADGKWAVCGSRTGEIALCDARTGKVLVRRNQFDRPVTALGFSPDGTRVGAADNQRRLKVWKLGPIGPPTVQAETRITVDSTAAPALTLNVSGETPGKGPAKTIENSSKPSLQAKVITDAAEFKSTLQSFTTINFDDINTVPKGDAVEFKVDRYATKGLLIEGTKGQFVSQDFDYPQNFIPVSKPNSYAPGPKADRKAAAQEGGHETTIKFVAGVKPAVTAGFGLSFIDANYPKLGESKLIAYDVKGTPLGEAIHIETRTGGNLFRGIVVLDDAGKPIPAIASVKIVNGSGWPEVSAAEGVSLDEFVFAPPVKTAP